MSEEPTTPVVLSFPEIAMTPGHPNQNTCAKHMTAATASYALSLLVANHYRAARDPEYSLPPPPAAGPGF